MNKKILTSIIFITILGSFYPAQATNLSGNECVDEVGYELYKCRSTVLCGEQSGRKPAKFIYDTSSDENSYLELEPSDPTFLSVNQDKYRNNMNNLYKCGLIQVQLNALDKVQKLIKDDDVESRINTKIDERIQSLESKKDICANIDDSTLYNKQTVLQQSSYEICRYINYLDYLDYYSDTISNTLVIEEEITAIELSQQQIQIKSAIQDEFDHVVKVFPLAYTAYSQYENNITIHLVLELIREDFIVLRTRLHSVLGPISQLIYKINNSMTRGN